MTTHSYNPLVMFPAFSNLNDLVDQYHRIKWYVPENSGYDVYLFIEPSLSVTPQEVAALVPEYVDSNSEVAPNIHFLPWSASRFAALAAHSSAVGVWRASNTRLLDKLSVAARRKFAIVDPSAKGTWEFVRYAAFLYDHLDRSEKVAMWEESKARLARQAQALQGYKKAYVFGTGPSLGRAGEFSYDDGVRIVCNSIVRNPELLAHIRPHFIAASDFVFHFGPSRYAAEFRRDLVAALETTGAYLLVPDQLAPLMRVHYPSIVDRIVAVPLTNRYNLRDRRSAVNVQLLDRFKVHTLDSVLNLLMLPVASTLADDVYIIGCDGRKPSDSGFWSHHGASQYTGLMKTVSDTHPGFFDVDYVDYYNRYCSHVASVIAAGEAYGKRYASLVPSYIPALSSRPADNYSGAVQAGNVAV